MFFLLIFLALFVFCFPMVLGQMEQQRQGSTNFTFSQRQVVGGVSVWSQRLCTINSEQAVNWKQPFHFKRSKKKCHLHQKFSRSCLTEAFCCGLNKGRPSNADDSREITLFHTKGIPDRWRAYVINQKGLWRFTRRITLEVGPKKSTA